MSYSRSSRFEAWFEVNAKYIEPADFWPWMEAAWQAAEAETARRCVELVEKHTRASGAITDDIKAEFPEAFK